MFITKNLLRKQEQCCQWDRKEMGFPPPAPRSARPGHQPSSRGEDLKGEAGKPVSQRAPSLLRPWGTYTPPKSVTGLGSPAQFPLLLA